MQIKETIGIDVGKLTIDVLIDSTKDKAFRFVYLNNTINIC